MGINSSRVKSDELYNEIKILVKDLIYEYQVWSSDKICGNIDIVYYDKIIKFNKDNLLDVSAAIGYGYNKQYKKDELCKLIIKHYKKRIDLLNYISNSITKISDRITQAKKGPICRKVNEHVDDFISCASIPNALWIDQKEYQKIVQNFKKDKRYLVWKNWIDKLDKIYNSSLKELLKIIRKIKQDIDNSISDVEFAELDKHARNVVSELDTYSEIYYLLAINFS